MPSFVITEPEISNLRVLKSLSSVRADPKDIKLSSPKSLEFSWPN